MRAKEIKIIIADDHDLIRQGLRTIIGLEEDLKIVREVENGKLLLDVLETEEADVVLLDVNMPIINGLEGLKRIKETYPKVKVIMLTIEKFDSTIRKAIDIGADGYVLKDSAGTEIVEAIRTVCDGEKYIDKSLVSILFSQMATTEEEKTSALDDLSRRELEVLREIARGHGNRKIGENLYISEKTVKNYATNVFRKLEVKDRVQATIFAIENDVESYYTKHYEEE